MRPILNRNVLQSLKESQFMKSLFLEKTNSIVDVRLLRNGELLQQQLLNHWKNHSTIREISNLLLETNPLAFLGCNEFKQSYQELCRKNSFDIGGGGIIVKTMGHTNFAVNEPSFIRMEKPTTLRLIADQFVASAHGLDHFYSTQRERKIWWMRCSADPSRYIVEPADLTQQSDASLIQLATKCQSMTIKSTFASNTTIDMESITWVPLNEIDFYKKLNSDFSLIRSVIDLDLTTCALLLDASEHNGEHLLLLNRKLAPFQCLVATYCEDKNADLDDLALHIEHVLRRASIRLYSSIVHANSKVLLQQELAKADKLGIPYTILIEVTALKQGLLKLRSRDTSLNETIHISDLPMYLLNIFQQ